MRQVLFEFAGFPVYSYWFFYGLGLLTATLLALWLAHRRLVNLCRALLLCLAAIISAVICARLTAVFFGTRFADLLDLQKSGQFSFGASFGALLVVALLAKPLRTSIIDVFDVSACAIPLAQGIQRIGCFLNGCCFGPVSNSILSVRFPKVVSQIDGRIIGTPCFIYHVENGLVSPSDLYSLPVFPTQLAASFVCLVVSGICIWLFIRKKLKGKLLGLYFALYGALRFILQWYRPDYDKNNVVSGWNVGHSICLLMLFVGLVILFSRDPEKKLFCAKNLSNKN